MTIYYYPRPDTGFSDYTYSDREPGECTCFVCWLPEPPPDADALDADVYDRRHHRQPEEGEELDDSELRYS